MSEIQKETDAMMLASGETSIIKSTNQTTIRKSRPYSQTPPPSKGQLTEEGLR